MKKLTASRIVFDVVNYVILIFLGLLCLLPLLNILAVSLSSKAFVEAGAVGLWPRGMTWDSYGYIFASEQFYDSLLVSVERTVLGTAITVTVTLLLAYPLSRSGSAFRGRGVYMAMVIFSMLFSGGLIPTYLIIANYLRLADTIWALVLPTGVQAFNAIITMNFFRQLPREIEEAAYVDGANHFHTLFLIVLPVSLPIVATITLFAFVAQWNSWFDGLIYNTQPSHYPLQTYLQQFMAQPPTSYPGLEFRELSDNSLASANIFVIIIPILLFYPLLQKYFIKGMVLGSVKG